MAKLTTNDRDRLHQDQFAGPGRTYPIPDKSHAEAAIRDSAHAEKVGNISRATEQSIDRKAEDKLHGDKGDPKDPSGHKAAVSKMHPEHVHHLVREAHAGKYGPEAQKAAQKAMASAPSGTGEPGDGTAQDPEDGDDGGARQATEIFGRPSGVSQKSAPRGGASDPGDDARSIFGSRR